MGIGVINLYTKFSHYGGAQKMAIVLHQNLLFDCENFLMGFTNYDRIDQKYPRIDQKHYLSLTLKNIMKYRNYIFISHHRKITTFLILLNKVFSLNLKVIHVSHNEFFSLKKLSFFPKKVVAVSNKVKLNLVEQFKIEDNRINVVYNGVEDRLKKTAINQYDQSNIRILYPARINSVKQQVRIVEHLRCTLNDNISIDFAGDGIDSDKLYQLCKGTNRFRFIGFVNIPEIINDYDFIMLFTKNEGLPLSLIEACMFQKPILANNVGGNLEILEKGNNGFELSCFDRLGDELNKLQFLSNNEYTSLALNARATFEKKFTLDKMYSQYKEIIYGNSFY